MSQKTYSNTNYIIYFDESLQYTSANNTSIFNLYDDDTLYSMWVNIRTFDFPICNKGWTLKTENGIPVFTVDYKGKPVSVQATAAINDAEWHLLCWGKFLENNKIRTFLTIDAGYIHKSDELDADYDFSTDEYFQIARNQNIYSTIYADEVFVLKGVKYDLSTGIAIYGAGVEFPGNPIKLWDHGELQCFWMFNNQNVVLDQSGNQNDELHSNNPKIAQHVP